MQASAAICWQILFISQLHCNRCYLCFLPTSDEYINNLPARLNNAFCLIFSFADELQHSLLIIPALINYHTASKIWQKIAYPFLNFNSTTVDVWEWTGNFIQHFMMDVITYLCRDQNEAMLEKWAPDLFLDQIIYRYIVIKMRVILHSRCYAQLTYLNTFFNTSSHILSKKSSIVISHNFKCVKCS